MLTYNVKGNGATEWSTNSAQVQAIGRQMLYLQPDVVTFNEIPVDYTYEMTNFVTAFLPGYFLAQSLGDDGNIHSVVLSRHPITRSRSWLDHFPLGPFGYTNSNPYFTRDLFEAEINVPGWAQHLHVFTTHLKATEGGTNYLPSLQRRAAEASAISNFFVKTFFTNYPGRPYVLTGDLNEDVFKPPGGSGYPVDRLISAPTGLRLTSPTNRVAGNTNTFSIRSSLSERLDYILPCGLLSSNIASSQVFRTDRLTPLPSNLLSNDSRTASDHLPVLINFFNPYDIVFQLTSIVASNQSLHLAWQTTPGRFYRIEASTNLATWSAATTNLPASSTNLGAILPRNASRQFFRVNRVQ